MIWTAYSSSSGLHIASAISASLVLLVVVSWILKSNQLRESTRLQQDVATRARESAEAYALLKTILDSTPAGVLLLDEDLRIRRANQTAEQLHGRELVGRYCHEILGNSDACRQCSKQDSVHPGSPCAESHDHRDHRTGELFEVVRHPAILPGGGRGAVMVERIVTQERQVLAALHKSERRYRALYENTPMMYFTLDSRGVVISVNAHGARELGYSVEELVGRSVLDVIHEEDRERIQVGLQCIMASHENVQRWEARKRRRDGTVISVAETARSFTDDDGGTMILVICENISARKHSEQRLNKYQDALRCLSLDLALAEERERRRIAIGLHDHVGQSLSLAKIRVQGLRHSADPASREELSRNLLTLLDQTILACRSLTFDLSSPVLYELGLEAALRGLGKQLETSSGIAVRFESYPTAISIPEDLAVILHRSVRELLRNIARHSRAATAWIGVSETGGTLHLEVGDDGVGMPSGKTRPSRNTGTYGLFSIAEQLRSVGGTLSISTPDEGGTLISIATPLTGATSLRPTPRTEALVPGGKDR